MRSGTLMIILTGALCVSFINRHQRAVLPVCIQLKDSSRYSNEILLNLKAAFGARKIKTISREELKELSKIETQRILEPYYRNLKQSGGRPDFEEIKNYMETHQKDVGNSLSISIPVTKDGDIGDTIKWQNSSIPFRFNDERRKIKNQFFLQASQKTSVMQIMQVITDSIVASNILIKE
jgi:hypothetical protein